MKKVYVAKAYEVGTAKIEILMREDNGRVLYSYVVTRNGQRHRSDIWVAGIDNAVRMAEQSVAEPKS